TGYISGDSRIKGWIVGVSFGATYASANMFMGVPGMAYEFGTPVLWWTALGFGLPFLALVLFSRRFYRMADGKAN
ncbi:MAG: hypothetical protein ABEJ98_00465, partial [Candidatus Nanohaloarchaea archaeon]